MVARTHPVLLVEVDTSQFCRVVTLISDGYALDIGHPVFGLHAMERRPDEGVLRFSIAVPCRLKLFEPKHSPYLSKWWDLYRLLLGAIP